MIKLTIDNHTIEVEPGTSVLKAAKKLGIDIPTMCYLEESGHFTSCMVCMVKDLRNGRLFASCSTPVAEGMLISSSDEETTESRKIALELLLSDHVGDCEAPCQLVCPAHMNIPLMNRLIAKGNFAQALEIVKQDIPIPAILGRICPAPCEAACRRKQVDEPVSICLLKRFVADVDLSIPSAHQDKLPVLSGKKVAIVGAGPAGLSAAYYLQCKGHQAVVYEQNAKAGGDLLKIDQLILPEEIIEKELAEIIAVGVQIHLNQNINQNHLNQFVKQYDAVVLAVGSIEKQNSSFDLKLSKLGIEIEKSSYLTSLSNVFAIGNSVHPSKMAVRAVGQGKEVAMIVDNYFSTGTIKGKKQQFNSKFGRLTEPELIQYLKDSDSVIRHQPGVRGFSAAEAIVEAKRCMHCDCRAPETCVLRELANRYQAVQKRFQGNERQMVEKFIHCEGIVYEPAKCIKCGICVRLTRQHQEEFGFTFIGRGFEVKVGIPFSHTVQKGLEKTASIVAKACPTGALALYSDEEQLSDPDNLD